MTSLDEVPLAYCMIVLVGAMSLWAVVLTAQAIVLVQEVIRNRRKK